jgi:hypothetical protein
MDTGRQDKDLAELDLAELKDEWRRLEEVASRLKTSCSREQKGQNEDEATRDAIEARLRLSIIASRRP